MYIYLFISESEVHSEYTYFIFWLYQHLYLDLVKMLLGLPFLSIISPDKSGKKNVTFIMVKVQHEFLIDFINIIFELMICIYLI